MAMDPGIMCSVTVVIVLMLILFILILRNRIIFFIALRNFLRHRTHTALVISGLFIGTTIISSALVLSDSLAYSSTERIYKRLGTTDVIIEPIDREMGGYMNYTIYESIKNDIEITSKTDGISPMVIEVPLAVINARTNKLQRGYSFGAFGGKIIRLMGVDFDIDRNFGPFYTDNGEIYGTEDSKGVIVNERLAKEIDLRVGDKLIIMHYTFNITATKTDSINFNDSLNHKVEDTINTNYIRANKTSVYNASWPNVGYLGLGLKIDILNVSAIAKDKGKCSFLGGMNIFLPLATMQSMYGIHDKINYIKVSNKGDMYSGLDLSTEVTDAIRNLIKTQFPGEEKRINVDAIKKRQIDAVQSSSVNFSGFLLMLSGFTIAAGFLLIINIFVMLAEERKVELGISRAIGLKRRHLIYLFTFEGLFYNLFATITGVFIGIVVAYLVIMSFNTIFPSMGGGNPIYMYINPSTPFIAFVSGFTLAFVVIVIASWRASKLNIITAIRDLEDSYGSGHGLYEHKYFLIAVLVIGLLGTLAYYKPDDSTLSIFLRFISPVLIFSSGCMLISRHIGKRYAMSALSILNIVFIALFLVFGPKSEGSENFIVFIAEGITLVLSSVLLFIYNAHVVFAPLRRIGNRNGRMKALIMPAIAYPINKRFRTGMTASMFSLVIFILVLFTIFFNLFTPDPKKESGGYEIWGGMDGAIKCIDDLENATTTIRAVGNILGSNGSIGNLNVSAIIENNTIDYDIQKDIKYFDVVWQSTISADDYILENVSTKKYREKTVARGGSPHGSQPSQYIFLSIMTPSRGFIDHTELEFKDTAAEFTSSADAWKSILEPKGYAIITRYYALDALGEEHKAGEYIEINYMNQSFKFKIAAIVDSMIINGIFLSQTDFTAIISSVENPKITSYVFIKVKAGRDPNAVANRMEDKYSIFGFNAVVFEDVYYEIYNAIASIFNVFKAFLGLGLIVGYASLGVIAIRSTIERRREIGMMRAIGFKKRDIMVTFLIESLIVTTIGVVIGLLTGVLATYGIYLAEIKDMGIPYNIPYYDLAIIFTIVYIAAILSVILPAIKASRVPVAEAVRYYE